MTLADDLLPIARARLGTLPTPLERGPLLPGGARLWVKRDDLTGLAAGGNKVRKLEFLCGAAQAAGARSLVTVGAAQSNHCRVTAAAGAVLGLDVHLVLAGDRPEPDVGLVGNQLLSALYGAQSHFTGAPSAHWGELEIAREDLTAELEADGQEPYSIPIGGSTPIGSLGYVAAYDELAQQCVNEGISPRTIVFTTSSGGTHAGLVAGRAARRADEAEPSQPDLTQPDVIGIGVAKGVVAGHPDVAELANETLALLGRPPLVQAADVEIDGAWLGDDYATPSTAGDAAIAWAARTGGWLLDRTYSGKGLSGLLGQAAAGRWGSGDDVIFIHTGGLPSLFAPNGIPSIH